MTDSFAASLQARHHDLEKQIEAELKRRLPDQMVLSNLKKEKLRIKEQLEGLQTA
jgi:hypothetical protein